MRFRVIVAFVALLGMAVAGLAGAAGVKGKTLKTARSKGKTKVSPVRARAMHEASPKASSAVMRRSLTKYVSSDPLWTAQVGCTGACWVALAVGACAPSLRTSGLHIRGAMVTLALKNYFGLFSDVKGLIEAAARASPDPEVIRTSVKELMGSPGAASYALYSLAVLLFVDTISYTLWPLLLREAWTTIGVIQDLLFITGVSKREEDGAEEGGEKGGVGKRRPAFGPARRPPPVLFSVGLVMEVGVGAMLLFEHVVGKRKLAWRSVVGLVLYINFLLARATQIPKLEEGRFTLARASGLLLSSVLDDLDSSAQELSTGLGGAVEKLAPGLLKVLDTEDDEAS